MSTKLDGGPAFPEPYVNSYGTLSGEGGMSLRDWFAGQVLGSIAEPWNMLTGQTTLDDENSRRALAQECYDMADAMIEARGKA